jgi:hypothetical protein
MSNLYFFNPSRGLQMDFSEPFLNVQAPDFEDVFHTWAATTKDKIYVAQEPNMNM